MKCQKGYYGNEKETISTVIIAENFPKITKDVNSKIWESKKILSKINEKKSTQTYCREMQNFKHKMIIKAVMEVEQLLSRKE